VAAGARPEMGRGFSMEFKRELRERERGEREREFR